MNPNGQLNNSDIINVVFILKKVVIIGLMGTLRALGFVLSTVVLPGMPQVLAVQFQVGKSGGVKLLEKDPQPLNRGQGL